MWLIVGLGNPGSKYALTRHNIGFMLIDTLVRNQKNVIEKTEQKAQTFHFSIENRLTNTSEKVILCKPQTFMNLSGDSVRGLMDFYKIDSQKIIVAHDEVDQPFGQLKIQKERGHGGHNGIRDIHLKLGHNKYYRVRLGVSRPSGPMDVADYVLAPFSKDEQQKLPDFLSFATQAVESLVFRGFEKTATEFNKLIE